MRVALVNTNRMQPPIAPIGLDYLAEALAATGHEPVLLDLCWENDPAAAIARFFSGSEFGLIGVTLRNTDDAGGHSFLREFTQTTAEIRRHTAAPVILGGVGFSVLPELVLQQTAADGGVWGEGEFAFPELAARLESNQEWQSVPNLLLRRTGLRPVHRNPASEPPLDTLPHMTRRWADNPRYFRLGGQAGFETKRGCPGRCIYCADPLAKGTRTRLRPPAAVADEIEALLAQGIDHLHTCDAEFNLPPAHAFAVCEELVRRGLGGRLRWFAYCIPSPFSPELARAMRAAGCAGINFGADNGDAEMLLRLGRGFTPDDILNAARWAKDAGMSVMLDLLLGAPGESEQSLTRTIELAKRSAADCVGVPVGVGVYPGTELARRVEGPMFVEPAVAPFIYQLLDRLIGEDPRFFFFDPSKPDRNYNYSGHQALAQAIERGERGAYWDILRRMRS